MPEQGRSLDRTLAKYQEQTETHRQAVERAREAGSEAACFHQMELLAWYEEEADKLVRKIARREHSR